MQYRYVVSYDLRQPQRDYESLYEALRALNGQRILESSWLITVQDLTAVTIRDRLKGVIDSDDRLLVNGFGNSQWASYNLMIKP